MPAPTIPIRMQRPHLEPPMPLRRGHDEAPRQDPTIHSVACALTPPCDHNSNTKRMDCLGLVARGRPTQRAVIAKRPFHGIGGGLVHAFWNPLKSLAELSIVCHEGPFPLMSISSISR